MQRLPPIVALLFLVLTVFFGAASVATAGALDDAKDAGLVGEQPDGFVAAVGPDPSPDIVALVERINDKRRSAYEEIATSQNVPVAQVGALAAEKIRTQAPAGHYFMTAGGQWKRK